MVDSPGKRCAEGVSLQTHSWNFMDKSCLIHFCMMKRFKKLDIVEVAGGFDPL
jgi:hypothetical protein